MKILAWYSAAFLSYMQLFYLSQMVFVADGNQVTNFWCFFMFAPVLVMVVFYLIKNK